MVPVVLTHPKADFSQFIWQGQKASNLTAQSNNLYLNLEYTEVSSINVIFTVY